MAIGNYAHAFTLGTVSIGSNAGDIEGVGNSNVALGDNASVDGESDHSVAIGSGSTASKAHEFSIGNNTLTREITHVSAPTAPNSASTKKYTDDNDANTLNEAKKYTDANTSNALVSTVSGKLLHVEDAWPGKTLGLTIDGAYKQDGTPSPESPVPITVIENPVLKVQGRNFAKVVRISDNKDIYSGVLFAEADIKPSTNYVLSFDVDTAGNNYYLNENLFAFKDFSVKHGRNHVLCETAANISESNIGQFDPTTKHEGWIILKNSGNQPNEIQFSNVQIERGSTVSDYAPYVGASLPITLPAEHPYLTALPDGTHDEIVIDKEGNASLVARVKRITLSEFVHSPSLECIDTYEVANVNNRVSGFRTTDFTNPNTRRVVCSDLPSLYDSWNTAKIGADWIDGLICRYSWDVLGIVDGDSTKVRVEKLKAYAQNKVDVQIYYPINTPVTYSLGKLDIPSLPEQISNVWTDAELTTNMSMTYKRDINVAFDNLVQAVVAAAAGE